MAQTDTNRIDVLSRSKRIHPGFLEDRRSVYWIEKWPITHGEDGTTTFAVTPRLEQLAQHKIVHQKYSGDSILELHMPTPIWDVSSGAKNAEATPRLIDLASHRSIHPNYLYLRSVYTEVPANAKSADASARLQLLSEPKPHKVWTNSEDTLAEGEFSEPITSVPLPAINAKCPPRVDVLAEYKAIHNQFQPNKQVQWPVSKNAMNATATTRLQLLARPKSGRLRNDDYDPYKVQTGARLARPSPRVTELAEPIPRKQRQKKNA